MLRTMTVALLQAVLAVLASAACPAAAEPAMVVVTPRAFLPGLDAWLAHRRAERTVHVEVLEELLASEVGVDDAERVKRRLHARWRDGARYVLLVGDVGVVPIRFMVLDRVTEPAFDHAFYPSDHYYADVAERDGSFEDWNAARDGHHARYFGEVCGEKHKEGPIDLDQVEYRAELAVGRWPVRSVEETARIARKTLLAERHRVAQATLAPAVRAPRAVFVHCDGWIDVRARLDRHAEAFAAHGEVLRCYDGGADAPRDPRIAALVARGPAFVFHCGHGDPGGFDRSLRDASLLRQTNFAALPVVFSIGCSTAVIGPQPPYEAYLDLDGVEHRGTNAGEVFGAPPAPPACRQPAPFDQTSIAERSLRESDGGAVAWIGCDTGAQPCALSLLDAFCESVHRVPGARLGDHWASAVSEYHARERLAELVPTADWYPPSIFFQGMKFVLLGDPALRCGG
jgi:hypothetical protein